VVGAVVISKPLLHRQILRDMLFQLVFLVQLVELVLVERPVVQAEQALLLFKNSTRQWLFQRLRGEQFLQ
jgi:hypothetical protein